jgi:methyltransferase (TIGR00027 family)
MGWRSSTAAVAARPNVSNVARARYIDDLLRTRLAGNPDLQIVLIGCGFDSRAFRLAGGVWFELDEPPLITYKEERLPAAQAPNRLRRIAIDFEHESLREKLLPLTGAAPTVFVIEGVTMYVTADALRATLEVLRSAFPSHEVIADLCDSQVYQYLRRHDKTHHRAVGCSDDSG